MDLVIQRTVKVGGVATDATSVILRDVTAGYGVKRKDTGAVVVAAGTAMTRTAAGVYRYTLSGAVAGVTYQYAVEVLLDGQTYRAEDEISAATTSAAEMVRLIRAALASSPIGVVSVAVDGQTVTYSRAQALDELRFWQSQAAKQSGRRPRVATINLGGFR